MNISEFLKSPQVRAAHLEHKDDLTIYSGSDPKEASDVGKFPIRYDVIAHGEKKTRGLLHRDLRNFRESGITDKTIRANELHTAKASAVYPYRDLHGNLDGFARLRPHKPRLNEAGKPIKYLQPKGTPVRAYFPAESVAELRDGRSPVFITEGEKKALSLAQEGYAAIGIGGVFCATKKDVDELIDDLAAIDWNGRDGYICFDFDAKESTRKQVNRAVRRLARALLKAGARQVYNVKLPPGPKGTKQGVDDFIVRKGADEFRRLVRQASPVFDAESGIPVVKIIPLSVPKLADAAYYGFVGEFLRAVAPHTEATDAGVLAHLLPAVGMFIGPGPHYWAGGKQFARLNAVVVGRTNSGRKGTSSVPVDLLMEVVDKEFWDRQRLSGLSSGEGVIQYVTDKIEQDEDGEEVIVPAEKRLMIVEAEFSRVLVSMRREGNVLSQIIRDAFDSGNLATLTVTPRRASGSHISIVGHITPEELSERLDHIDMANGFGNRFLWFAVESDKIMPFTQPISDEVFDPFVRRLRELRRRLDQRPLDAVAFDEDACNRWKQVYPRLREDRPGLPGQLCARGHVMVLRIAVIYALLDSDDSTPAIRMEHLEAALAVWEYCEQSAELLFQSRTGDKLSDKLLKLLANGPLTRDEFNRHLSSDQKQKVGPALEKLEDSNLVRRSARNPLGAGRPAAVWELV
jgi:hypothetical protein